MNETLTNFIIAVTFLIWVFIHEFKLQKLNKQVNGKETIK